MNIHVASLNTASCRPRCSLLSALLLPLFAALACGAEDDVVQLDGATDAELADETSEIASAEQALRRPAAEIFEVIRDPVPPEEPDVTVVELTVSECTWLAAPSSTGRLAAPP